jgi:Endonuclease/Exonuclease/phosphatase family
MELSAGIVVHARHGDGTHRSNDHGTAQIHRAPAGSGRRLAAGLICAVLAGSVAADPIRIATYNTELSRDGPGLLLRDILRGEDDQIPAVMAIIARVSPDILLLQGIDYDAMGYALAAFTDALETVGAAYPYQLALRPNTGIPTGLDLDGNGRLGDARDAQGYGRFNGAGGMAVLSRFPIDMGAVVDHSGFLWADLPGGQAREVLSPQALAIQRLASVAAWEVPIAVEGQVLRLLTIHATPPVFDGPEDRNGRRNADELRFWQWQIESGAVAPPFVLAGVLNADPVDGDARRETLRAMLDHPALQDPAPQSAGGGGTDTADWRDPVPGNLRASYILPSADIRVTGSGVFWPAEDDPDRALLGGSDGNGASRHRLVWIDIELQGAGQH